MAYRTEHFTRISKEYIQCDIRKKYGLSRKFYIIYLLIDKYRSYDNDSWLTVKEVLECCGYKIYRNKPKAFGEVLDILRYLSAHKMIETCQDLSAVDYDTGIKIKVLPGRFCPKDNFCKITSSQLNTILNGESTINKETILLVFLYILSYIYIRPAQKKKSVSSLQANEKPQAFWRSTSAVAKELGISKNTLKPCLDFLTSSHDDNPPLLRKKEARLPNQENHHLPNIYALNTIGWERELALAENIMLEAVSREASQPITQTRKGE